MFYSYEIKRQGIDDVLYLYLNMAYEFSKDLGVINSSKDLTKRCKNFIKNNNINYSGNKIYLVIDGIIVKSLDLRELDEEIETLDEDIEFSNNKYLVTVILDNNIKVELTLKDYLLGVMATNSLDNLENETLKVLAIIYRTYAYKEMHEKKEITASNSLFKYKPINYFKLVWLNNYDMKYRKIESAINDTDREFITYNDEYIIPFMHICSNGYTTSNSKYPYLVRKSSLWDYKYKKYINVLDYPIDTLRNSLNIESDIYNIEILELNENNTIKNIKIGNKIVEGKELIDILKLASLDTTIIMNNKKITFITRGVGNFLGLSQYGANELALMNCNYVQIIKYYYNDVKVKRYI